MVYQMQITILCDNNTLTYVPESYLGEPGFSVLIEDGVERILFDCGYTDVFLRNAEHLGISFDTVTKIAFSHGHDDHTGGLKYLLPRIRKGTDLYAHPETFCEKLRGTESVGSAYRADDLSEFCTMHLSKGPQKISEHLTLLGEIPSLNDFEPRKQFDMKRGEDGVLVPDFVTEDTALVYEDEAWIFIITGCSHAGICNIAEYAARLFGKPVRGILGGFHMKDADVRTAKTIAYFKEHRITGLYPCHCVSFAVKAAIDRVLPIHECGAGMKVVVE